ncbi:MAG: sensor histidine kinase [Lewinellaceae bacterium]|nr:sensor histidine kinase [Saprospiraceae bacterium]MCB9340758.1 sensor histidine kinase [Lewinellaceae bacterium]
MKKDLATGNGQSSLFNFNLPIKDVEFFSKQNLKNPTPQRIAIFSSLSVAFILTLFWLLLDLVDRRLTNWWMPLVMGTIAFFASYLIFSYYLKQYIYRKIKVIYKSIHQHKLSSTEKKEAVDMRSDIMEEVEKEVEEWAAKQEKEIQQLKTWQDYRRKFLGDISHELKTPIFNIQGYLETLLDGGLEDAGINKTYLQRAAKNVDRLNTIVEDLEIISRLESGELILDMQTFDIKTLTEEVFEDLEIKGAERNIKLAFKPGADQHFRVRADREYIRQVLMNLLNNSIKYGNENGMTKVSFYDMDKNVLVEVADSGIGIPAEHLNHVFDRFYRVDKSRSREQGGSGLGLSIVKHIIEAHKQTINVRSTKNVGSTFGFTLEKS